jgi:hypothetical protein
MNMVLGRVRYACRWQCGAGGFDAESLGNETRKVGCRPVGWLKAVLKLDDGGSR